MCLMLELIKKILKLPCDTLIIDKKNNKCMTYQYMKVLSNGKHQYFSFVKVVTMPSIDLNNLKLLYLSIYVINNQSEIETN